MIRSKAKTLLGRTDIADFPKLKLFGINIKVDSGAYTSSIHCQSIELENGILKCQFLDPSYKKFQKEIFCFENFTERLVKSSNGITEKRFLITTEILIFNKNYPIELSLTERDAMRFPVLLGRKFLTRKFIIDPSKKNLSYKKIFLTK